MIKTFIIRCCVFVTAGLIALGGLSALHLCFFKSVFRPANLAIGSDSDVIVIGDSHIQTGIDQKLLTRAVKISSNSMHYVYSYSILRTLLEANPHVKAVVLGYSYHNLNEYYDGVLRENTKARFKVGEYYYLFGNEEKDAVRAETRAYFETVLKYHYGLPIQLDPGFYVKAVFAHLRASDFPFWGKVYESRASNLSQRSLKETLQRHFFTSDGKEQDHSELQKRYLQRIAGLCRARKVQLYLLITPLHPMYQSQIPKDMIRAFNDFTGELISEGAVVWDHSGDKFADFMFGDADHLNVYGSQVLSRALNRRLEEIR